jgi:hypothetical protein
MLNLNEVLRRINRCAHGKPAACEWKRPPDRHGSGGIKDIATRQCIQGGAGVPLLRTKLRTTAVGAAKAAIGSIIAA